MRRIIAFIFIRLARQMIKINSWLLKRVTVLLFLLLHIIEFNESTTLSPRQPIELFLLLLLLLLPFNLRRCRPRLSGQLGELLAIC